MSHKADQFIAEQTNPGANKTLTVYDEAASSTDNAALKAVPIGSRSAKRARVFLFADQIVTVNVYAKSSKGAAYRLIATQASTASTALTKEFPFYGVFVKIDLVTTTIPTVWEYTIAISDDGPALT